MLFMTSSFMFTYFYKINIKGAHIQKKKKF